MPARLRSIARAARITLARALRRRPAVCRRRLAPRAAGAPGGAGPGRLAGWVPGGRQVLVAREARGEGRDRRTYEVIALDTLLTQRQAAGPDALGPFRRWSDPWWKRLTVGLR
jgi:hypothetical protein